MTDTVSIEICGPGSLAELVAAVGPIVDYTRRGRPVVDLGRKVFATVRYEESGEYPYLLDIGSGAPNTAQRGVADALFEQLRDRTEWALRRSPDSGTT